MAGHVLGDEPGARYRVEDRTWRAKRTVCFFFAGKFHAEMDEERFNYIPACPETTSVLVALDPMTGRQWWHLIGDHVVANAA